MNKTLTKDMENMEEIMVRTAHRCDIWQDRAVYHIAKAVLHILDWVRRREDEINYYKRTHSDRLD